MNKALLVFPILVLVFALPAQKDTIELLDGTTIRGVKVISWTAKEIKFKTRSGSGTESRPAHEVRGAKISRVQVILSKQSRNVGSNNGWKNADQHQFSQISKKSEYWNGSSTQMPWNTTYI